MAYSDSDFYMKTLNGESVKDVPKWIWDNVREPTLKQKKKLIILTLNKMIELTLTNHLYQFDNKIYKQVKGGPIGENLTQMCAKIVMYSFVVRYRKKLAKLSLLDQTMLLKIYVDDLNQAGYCLPTGSKYLEGKLYIPNKGWFGRSLPGRKLTEEQKTSLETEADIVNRQIHTQDDRERQSAQIYRQIANECRPRSVKMKEDTPGNHEDRMLPILDTKMAVVGGQIIHHHYTKPMASLEVTLERSAISKSAKYNILVQEGAKRLRNMCPSSSWESKLTL